MQYKEASIDKKYFGEGSTLMKGKIYMMTWTDRVVFVFNQNLELESTLSMPAEMKEGWGLTHDDNFMYSTDGTANIYKINPDTFKVISQV
jgi:glutamine cyclotransferase